MLFRSWAWFDVVLADEVSGPRPRLVTGRDLIDAGLVPGPRFRALLDAAAEAQDDGRLVDAQDAARWVRAAIRP